MERGFREDELIGATVIDSEGYIYGKVERIGVKEDEIDLIVYETKPDERTVVDMDTVKKELLKTVELPFTAKLQKLSQFEVLAQNIRKEFELKSEDALTDQHYIRYAERLGIEVPYRKVTQERKEPKGKITLNDVETIKITTMGTKERSSVIKVIFLHEPKEADFRKIPVQKTIPYRNTEVIKDKLVIDSSGAAVGYVDSIVLYHDTPGIRIYSAKPTDSISVTWLFQHLENIGRPDIADAIKKYFGTKNDSHVYRIKMDDLEDFMTKTKLAFRVPESVLLDQSVKEFAMDIPWDMVHKIGDVVLLRQTVSDLRSKGY